MKKKEFINLENLKKLRKERGLTIGDVSKELKICNAFYCQIENGKRNLSYMNAIKIARIFNMTPDQIFLIEN